MSDSMSSEKTMKSSTQLVIHAVSAFIQEFVQAMLRCLGVPCMLVHIRHDGEFPLRPYPGPGVKAVFVLIGNCQHTLRRSILENTFFLASICIISLAKVIELPDSKMRSSGAFI